MLVQRKVFGLYVVNDETSQCAGDVRRLKLYSWGAIEWGKGSESIKLAAWHSLY